MDQIRVTALFASIPPDNVAEFKKLAAQALEITKNEAGALQYDWFLSDDESACAVQEVYADSNAVLAHVIGLGDLFGQLLQVGGGCSFEVFGQPSAELIDATSGLDLTVYPTFLQGK